MRNLLIQLANKLDNTALSVYAPLEAYEAILVFANESAIPEKEKKMARDFARLFLYRVNPRPISAPPQQRFSPFSQNEAFTGNIWTMALEFSPLIKHPSLAAFIDDLLLENKARLEEMTISGYSFRDLFKRTIARYLAKVDWLEQTPDSERPELWEMALADALDRAIELSVKFNQDGFLEQALTHLWQWGGSLYTAGSWRWLLNVIASIIRVIDDRKLGNRIAGNQRQQLVDWAGKAAEGFIKPGEPWHLINYANEMAARIKQSLGEIDAYRACKQSAAKQIEQVARRRAESGQCLAAACILDQAIIPARESGNQSLVDHLSSQKVSYSETAKQSGEIRKQRHEIEVEKECWDAFISPFRNATSPEQAMDLWISCSDFVPDYEALRSRIIPESIFSQVASMSILSGWGLQTAGQGLAQTSNDLNREHALATSIQLLAGLFMEPALSYIIEEKGVNQDLIIARLSKWPLVCADNIQIVDRGIRRFFDQDYICALHILTPQFEGLLRRAFHRAGYKDAIVLEYSTDEGISQTERTLGSFLRKDDIKKVLGDRLTEHFIYIFTEPLGLNLRNKIAHGIIEQELLSRPMCCIVLHCIMILTHLTMKEETTS